MDSLIIQQGVELMMFGMGTVFVFLTILVFSTTIMSSVISKFLPEAVVETRPVSVATKPTNKAVDPKVLAVIQDAIYQHRAKTR